MQPKHQIDSFRREFMDELPALAREYIDIARAEATTQSYEKVMNTALKVIEGLQVQEKKDVYANLPVIHVSFGPGMQMATTIEASPEDPTAGAQTPLPAPDVLDAIPRALTHESPFATSASAQYDTLPADPLDLLPQTPPVHAPEEDETLRALELAGSAMVMD